MRPNQQKISSSKQKIAVTSLVVLGLLISILGLGRVFGFFRPIPPHTTTNHSPGPTLAASIQPTTTSPSPSPTAKPRRPHQTPTPPPPPPQSTPAQSFAHGIAAGSSLPGLSTDELNKRLNGIRTLGVGWIRFDIEWANIESVGPGQYDWSSYDRVVQAVISHGLKPLAILDSTPGWARPAGCSTDRTCAPQNPDDYGHFAGAAANHYSGLGVHTWEIWNEPNIQDYFKPSPDPSRYTAMLEAAFTAIKQADPTATVLTGGTAPASTDGTHYNAVDFLAAVYAAGGHGSFDAVGHHPYTFPYTVDNAYPGGAWDDLTNLHNLMSQQGDGAKKVWATEYGAPTNGPGTMITGGNGPFSGSVYVSETLQATIAAAALTKYRTYSWAGPLFWFTYQDPGTTTDTIENFFGLLRFDGSAKPAFEALRHAIQ